MMDCCIRQTFKDWELIIVDDQSSDRVTQQIGKEYSEKDNRIKFLVRDREPKGSQEEAHSDSVNAPWFHQGKSRDTD